MFLRNAELVSSLRKSLLNDDINRLDIMNNMKMNIEFIFVKLLDMNDSNDNVSSFAFII